MARAYWLVKSEPSTYSWGDLVRDGGTRWDGVSNALEYVLGGTALTKDLSKLPTVSTSGGNVVFTFKRARSSIDAFTSVAIEVGNGLSAWANSYTVGADTAGSSAGVTVNPNVPSGFDTITLSIPQAPDARKFARLKVSLNP